MKLFINKGAKIDIKDDKDNTALHTAAQHDSQNATALLIETCEKQAEGQDKKEAVKALLSQHNNAKETPLKIAKKNQKVNVFKILIKHTPLIPPILLHESIKKDRDAIVEILIPEISGRNATSHLPFNELDKINLPPESCTALDLAVQRNKLELVKLLIDHGASVVRNKKSALKTAKSLHYEAQHMKDKNKKIIQLLKKAKKEQEKKKK